ncbi:MAG: hypothetical protein HOH14_03685 [Gammaproteobacteria bacterium]|jgi:uncharacterized protein YqgV (UPF0045/DUF77 family)|nr:hypothetical protein [Gammaproteobacteria bacterium]MBT6042577.1 hypothetical protein [Gammaproteobacteria bacterium]
MQLTVEISMYPFNEDYKTLIKGFITQLNKCEGLIIKTSETSTMVHGEYDHLMDSLKAMIAWSYTTHGRAVFVTKFIPGHELTD